MNYPNLTIKACQQLIRNNNLLINTSQNFLTVHNARVDKDILRKIINQRIAKVNKILGVNP